MSSFHKSQSPSDNDTVGLGCSQGGTATATAADTFLVTNTVVRGDKTGSRYSLYLKTVSEKCSSIHRHFSLLSIIFQQSRQTLMVPDTLLCGPAQCFVLFASIKQGHVFPSVWMLLLPQYWTN